MNYASRRRYKAWLKTILQKEDINRDDMMKIIRGQLMLPARELDGGLLKECFSALYTLDDANLYGRQQETWAGILHQIRQGENGKKAWLPLRGRRRLAVLILAGVLLLALAAAAIATAFGYRIFGFPFPADDPVSYVQEGAYTLMKQNLKHVSYDHVDVDILEAVYDGMDLRVVYSVWDRNATERLTDEDLYHGIAAAKLDGVTCVCDWIVINGQDANLSDAAEEPGERNGEMIYSIEALLSDQGIHPEGDFTVGLPLIKNEKNLTIAPVELTFTINAEDAKKWVRTAYPAQMIEGNYRVAITEAEFSPMSGAILLTVSDTAYVPPEGEEEQKAEYAAWIGGDNGQQSPLEKEAYLWGGMAQLFTQDGKQVGITETEYYSYKEGPGLMPVKLRVTPPEGEGWPEKMFLAVCDINGKPDPVRRIPVVLK